MTDSERFSELISLPKSSLKTGSGVGILGEKYLHAVLKSFFEPEPAFHEQKAGRFTADILRDGIITEIQTRSLDKLRPKLDYYLCEGYRVRVVLPLPHIKWLIWVDPETGELGSKRRSGRRGSFYDAFWELYKIKDYLGREGVSVCLVLVDLDEYRWLNGFGRTRKRRSTRMERRPVGLGETAELSCPESGIALEVYTTEPGLQFYSGNFLDGTQTGKNGKVYGKRAAACLETQHYPDSRNKPDWPSVVLRPGESYESETIFKFTIR